jgi:glycosyltransferase involved in cell wall biosynthesis
MSQKLFSPNNSRRRVAYISTYPPRQCGIATFTKDLIDAVEEVDGFTPTVIALNDKGAIYDYDRRVKFIIERDSEKDYSEAAEYINTSNIAIVNLQHEFGLFGGDHGNKISIFLDKVNKPVVTTLHTVQPDFDPEAKDILKLISKKSKATVFIAHSAAKILRKQGISIRKYAVIPHGCPEINFKDNLSVKESLGLKDKTILSTFGLISSGKGIEYVIQALPQIVKNKPQLLYLIIGQTHPEVRKHEGEKYRNTLMNLASKLGLDEHVRFDNRYLSKRELIKYLQATDIYLAPYSSPNQISSGALTYAMGAGNAVVSTPFIHAQELLASGRGVFCKFKDPASIAEGINSLLDEKTREIIQKRVYRYSRRFLWTNVAKNYVKLFKTVINQSG